MRPAVLKRTARRAKTLRKRVAVKEQILTQPPARRSLRKLLREAMSLRRERLKMMNLRLNIPRTNRSHRARAPKKKSQGVETRVDGQTGLPRGKELPPDLQPLSEMTCPHSLQLMMTHLLVQAETVPWRPLTLVTCPQLNINQLYLLQHLRYLTPLSTGFPPYHPSSPLCMDVALLQSSNALTEWRREHMVSSIEQGIKETKRLWL